jgi:catechol-2,3-dioxygenase
MITEIEHVSICVNDLEEAEHFYVDVLGEVFPASLESRKYYRTADLVMSKKANRIDPPQTRVNLGDSVVALFLYEEHVQEPPPDEVAGAPLVALTATREQIARAVEAFRRHRIPFEGPVEHEASAPIECSVFVRDPSGNFLELCCPRPD